MKRQWLILTAVLLLFFCSPQKNSTGQVRVGLDRIEEFSDLFANKRLGIIANHTSFNSQGVFILDAFRKIKGARIRALFGPEHGFRGNYAAGQKIEGHSLLDSIPIYSLYGKTRKPTSEMLKEIDVLIFDIQDIGARFYTYIWTMALAMEAAAEHNIPFVVLDRPNPINGVEMEGPVLDTTFASFVGMFPIPVRHGMTVGELAKLFNEEGWLKNGAKARLTVIPVKNWKREQWFDETGLEFIAPSPNMPDLTTATVYPGLCLLEGTNISEGRGTDTPFVQFGAPFIDSSKLLQALEKVQLPGVHFEPVHFTPQNIPGKANNPKFLGQLCYGLRLVIDDRNAFKPFLTGVRIVQSLHRLFPEHFSWRASHFDRLVGTNHLRVAIEKDQDLTGLFARWQLQINRFKQLRKKYLLYH